MSFPQKQTISRLAQSANTSSLISTTFDVISYVASFFRRGHFIRVKYSLFWRGHHQSTRSGNFRQRQKLKTDSCICHVLRSRWNQYSSYHQRFHALIQRECFFAYFGHSIIEKHVLDIGQYILPWKFFLCNIYPIDHHKYASVLTYLAKMNKTTLQLVRRILLSSWKGIIVELPKRTIICEMHQCTFVTFMKTWAPSSVTCSTES